MDMLTVWGDKLRGGRGGRQYGATAGVWALCDVTDREPA
jgi:hypothetical protein